MISCHHLLFEEPLGSVFTAVHVFSESVFCKDPDALGASSASEIWTKKFEAAKKSNSCKNISDIAGHSIEIDWHACLGDTSVQIWQKLKAVMSEAAHEPEHFPDRIIFASMFNDITSWESQRMQAINVLFKGKKKICM